MSAMPAEAEPRRPGPGEAELPMTGPEAAQLPIAGPEAAQLPMATAPSAQPFTGPPRTTQARTASAGRAVLRTALPAATEVAAGEAATAEPRPGLSALRPATVRPRQAGLTPGSAGPRLRPAGLRPAGLRPAGLRPRRIGTRLHPTGVRACSDVMRAERLTATRPVPQAGPSLPGDASQSLRLTRRGRMVLALFAAVAASLFALAAARGTTAAGSAAPAGIAGHSMTQVVVQPGQTLWSIAMRADPHADPRLVVQRIITANALPGGTVQAGQRLLVPRG